ncbi:MAG: TPM domain-containing protein [Dinghuibacter sp.]|nr:TPM domain-containing protein [Dinghuibacter sp.]
MKLPWQKTAQDFFSASDKELIVTAIRKAERRTSGEVRVFVESRCSYVNPLDRAMELFFGLKMDQTEDRNAVLLYVAMKDRQLAIFGDKGIHEKMGSAFWQDEIDKMIAQFSAAHYGHGIANIVNEIGAALNYHFPYEDDDKNELPDDIVFGK